MAGCQYVIKERQEIVLRLEWLELSWNVARSNWKKWIIVNCWGEFNVCRRGRRNLLGGRYETFWKAFPRENARLKCSIDFGIARNIIHTATATKLFGIRWLKCRATLSYAAKEKSWIFSLPGWDVEATNAAESNKYQHLQCIVTAKGTNGT